MRKSITDWERGFKITTRDGTPVKFVAIVDDGSPCPITVRVGERMQGFAAKDLTIHYGQVETDEGANYNNSRYRMLLQEAKHRSPKFDV